MRYLLQPQPRTAVARRSASGRATFIALTAAISLPAGLATLGAAAGPSEASQPATATPPSAPLDSSLATTEGTWADLAMGDLAQVNNTFWELFVLPSSRSRWALVTPPGVAANGGLVSSTAKGAPFVAGFETSQDLGFSPLASTTSDGKHWQAGLVPSGLALVPDAIATSGQHSLALLGSNDTSIEANSGDLATWRTVASEKSLAASAAGRACRLLRVTAVAYAPSGNAVVGGACAAPGRVGIFEEQGGSWDLATVHLPATDSRATTSVLRMSSADGRLVALVAATGGSSTSLVGVAPTSSAATWSSSASLQLKSAERIESTGVATGSGLFVLLATGKSRRAELLGSPVGTWRELPTPPADTATLAFSPGGRIDALAIDRSLFTDFALQAQRGSWTRSQQIDVPIQYGSSG